MVRSSRTKDHKSAICIIPPRHLWDAIQDIRLFNDKGFVRCDHREIKEIQGSFCCRGSCTCLRPHTAVQVATPHQSAVSFLRGHWQCISGMH